ncbi:MAG: UDP-N-acetylglucosamine--N-acetylmuramyl-(pentapeptide) pyrophosphoryl-undecaprenol N-acetylglucosamine transferase [Patescibacteria group bacterium]|jgi:UDP-N-acetylglucosamine--N-acetylmuramyl-(pentapeptide) pyrophosphoryl-undecaprenol N-acetylglucosamine transferase
MKYKILLSGGGTMGSVSPLIAVYQEIKKRQSEAEFLFVGTANGPERSAVESYKIPFLAVTSGKFRRYFSWQNFIDPFKIIWGFLQSLKILLAFRPQLVMVAGAYVGVPLAWAAGLLRIPILIHQQDIEVGLANRLMSPVARKITVSFDISLRDFKRGRATLTGNPIREEFSHCDKEKSRELFGLKKDVPIVFFTGGGTGAATVNKILDQALPDLMKFIQVIHVTGKGKKINFSADNYRQFEFITHEMPEALCVADLVVTRAGLSTLSELSYCGKPSIIIPMYRTHQEDNANYFQKHNAAVVLSEVSLNKKMLADVISELIKSDDKLDKLSKNIRKMMPQNGAGAVADIILQLIKKKK